MEGDCSALPVKRYRRSISIHALRVEGDPALFRLPISFPNFYPRPPGWRATTVGRIACAFEQFLSTPSGWRTTPANSRGGVQRPISIHALRVEGDPARQGGARANEISIHALRVEGDLLSLKIVHAARAISIHALRVEGDQLRRGDIARDAYFYPRPPGGGRPYRAFRAVRNRMISIHALRVEGDFGVRLLQLVQILFLSTPSGWRATSKGE